MIGALDETQDDDVLGSLATLGTYDVSPHRSRQLRHRCHALLRAEPLPQRWAWTIGESPSRRLIVSTIGGAWCLAYRVEIIRCTTAIYRYFDLQ